MRIISCRVHRHFTPITQIFGIVDGVVDGVVVEILDHSFADNARGRVFGFNSITL